jgi:hypothetical protein
MNIRGEIIKILATPGADTRFFDGYLPKTIREAAGCRHNQVWEALWGLTADGLIYLDPSGQGSSSTDNWRWKLSERGLQAASGGPWEPRDPEGYLRRLRRRIPDLDPIALRYVQEALGAFNARCYLASSVMLGVASEQIFIGLAQSVVEALGPSAESLRRILDNPRGSQHTRFLELRKRLEPMRSQLPDDLADTLTLDAVADLLRITRNDAGHPTGRDVDEDTAYTHLQMAARYLEKMIALQRYFEKVKTGQSTPP